MTLFATVAWVTFLMQANVAAASPRELKDDLAKDIGFVAARVATDHPGMVNPLDPTFAERAKAAAAAAKRQATFARTDADYTLIMETYFATFHDPHMSFSSNQAQNETSANNTPLTAPSGNFAMLSARTALLTLPTFYAGDPAFDSVVDATQKASLEMSHKLPQTLLLDLRGNGGGAAEPGDRVLAAIWGPNAPAVLIARRPKKSAWRVSPNVLRDLEERRSRIAQRYPTELVGFDALLSGLRAAAARGQTLYEEPVESSPSKAPLQAGPQHVFVITDRSCISACLDFMDRILDAPGVVQVGQPTGWDTLYTEVETVALPSERATVTIPMQLLEGRYRASRQSYEPKIPLVSDGEVIAWVAQIAALKDQP